MIIGITGLAGSGKDTIADWLVSHAGFLKYSMADPLYEQVSEAFGVSVEFLHDRSTKEIPTPFLALEHCSDRDFIQVVYRLDGDFKHSWHKPRSPRQILQWWGTEYRRASDPEYWIKIAKGTILKVSRPLVIPDVRYTNEAKMVSWTSYNSRIIRVVRSGQTKIVESSHPSEQGIPGEWIDYTLVNHGSKADLGKAVENLMKVWKVIR